MTNDREKFWTSWLFWTWFSSGVFIAIAASLLVGAIPLKSLFQMVDGIPPELPGIVRSALVALVVFIVAKKYFDWWKDCWAQVEFPNQVCQAVLTQFGRPDRGLEPGWYFTVPPIEKTHLFPRKQYDFIYQFKEGVYTKETGKYSSQKVRVLICAHINWPVIGVKYDFPITEQEARERGLDPDNMEGEDLDEGLVWGEIDGEDLLVNYSYPHLPVDSLVEGSSDKEEDRVEVSIDEASESDGSGPDRELGLFLESAFGGATRQIVQEKSHGYWRKHQSKFEKEIRDYLTKEKANPVVKLGLPKACLNIELLEFEIPEETIQAYMQPELERKRAEAAEEAIEKYKFEKEQLEYRLEAYLEKGIPPWMAAIAASGVGEGEQGEQGQLNEQQMRDWMFIRMLGAMGNEDLSNEQELKNLLEQILDILKNKI